MRLPVSARIRAFFSRDKYSFWWKEFTDRDKELSRMSTRQLAQELNTARINESGEEQIIIEHLLNQRLVQMQSNASWGAGALGFVGAIVGAALSVPVASVFQEHHEQIKCVCECAVTDHPNGATWTHPNRSLERGQDCVFPPFVSDGWGVRHSPWSTETVSVHENNRERSPLIGYFP